MKLLKFLRSMRFGLVLLGLIAAFSVVGSVIPQGRELAWYVENYPGSHPLLLMLQLNKVFSSWYFLALLVLLCLNLALCSLTRIPSLGDGGAQLIRSAAALPGSRFLTAEGIQRLEQHLTDIGCRRIEFDGARVYVKNRIGRYGSFLTHLAILLTVLFGAAALYLPRVIDMDCLPGDSIRLPAKNGGVAEFSVASFRVTDENGRLDFTSDLTVTLPDGRSKNGEISVNHPMRFGSYKVYQQSYGTAASVTVTNLATDGSDVFLMADPSLLSLNGHDGIWFVSLFPDHLTGPDGEIVPAATGDNSYPNPVYYVQTVDGDEAAMRFFLPGDTVEVGQLRFLFNDPAPYPGLRIKYTPPLINVLLILSFVLMIAGLWLLFFLPPAAVKVDDEGYAVGGPKPEGMRLELEELTRDYEKEDLG